MAVSHADLQTELSTDPLNLGYAPHVSAEQTGALVQLLNATGLSGLSTIDVKTVTSLEMQKAVVAAEYVALDNASRDLWNSILIAGVGSVEVEDANMRQQVLQVWSAGTTTRGNLAALQTRNATRAEELFGADVRVNEGDVGTALRL